MSTASIETPLHDPDDPARATAYCGHCREEKAAGLRSYGDWRARHRFPPHLDQPEPIPTHPQPTAGFALKAVIRRAQLRLGRQRRTGRDTVAYLPGWEWRLYDGPDLIEWGSTSTWLAARAHALDAYDHRRHA